MVDWSTDDQERLLLSYDLNLLFPLSKEIFLNHRATDGMIEIFILLKGLDGKRAINLL